MQTKNEIDWNWAGVSHNPGWHDPTSEVLIRHITPNQRVLEIGAGASYALARIVARLNCKGFGVDPDHAGILKANEFAQSQGARVHLIQGDGFNLPFDDRSFGVVFSQGVIEHFSLTALENLVKEHRRVCSDEGRVIISVPNWFNFPHTIRKALKRETYEYFPEMSLRPGKLKKILRKSGLVVTEVDGVLPLWGFGGVRGWWKVIAALDRLGLLDIINNLPSGTLRAYTGYMTYAICRKI
jgi:SAM-dependent methyltransferase